MDWTTEEIVKASLDRCMVEKAFRQTKDDDLVSILPLRHWTDGKIGCHILTCVVALTYLRIIGSRLNRAGLKVSAATAMKHMQTLHSCLYWTTRKGNPTRLIEEPTEIQTKIIKAFGYKLESGVLQKANQ
jgi:transposase